MSSNLVNAAPMGNLLGVKDLSNRPLPVVPEALPQHLPFVYLYAKKGPTDEMLVAGTSRELMYDSDSFDMTMPWATHQTVLSNTLNQAANAHFIKRLQPADSATASLRMYADVLATKVPNYQYNIDGSIKKDPTTGAPVLATPATIDGYSVKFIAAEVLPDEETGDDTFGQGTIIPGDQTNVALGTQSERYPLFDLRENDFGAYGNLDGVRIYAPTTLSNTPVDTRLITQNKVYPFRMSCIRRSTQLASPGILATTTGEQYVDCVLKPNFLNPFSQALEYAGDVFIPAYQDLDNPANPPQFGPYGQFHVYDNNFKTLLDLFVAAELPFIDGFSDLVTDDTDQTYRFNMFGGLNSSGSPYHTFQILMTADDEFRFGESSNIYGRGGADGTMDETSFAALVSIEAVRWLDPNDVLQNMAVYPVSDIYDTGFPLQTKYDLISFISQRKDTFLTLVPYDTTGHVLSLSEESSLAIAILARMRNFPESDYFGTPTVRGAIVGRSGTLIGSAYRKNLPLSIELAAKCAAYMGAGDGKWKAGKNFDYAPGNQITLFKDINITNVPASVRNKDWDNGLNWVEYYDRRTLYFPALQTIYPDDTSVLNSILIAKAICTVEKVGEQARRRFSGVTSLTNAQLIDRVNKFVTDNTEGRFDNVIVVQPDCFFTDADLQRGFSWSLRIKVYGPNMKTIQTLFLESYRIEDLTTANQ